MVFTNRNTFIYFIPFKKLRGPLFATLISTSTILRQAQQPAQGPTKKEPTIDMISSLDLVLN